MRRRQVLAGIATLAGGCSGPGSPRRQSTSQPTTGNPAGTQLAPGAGNAEAVQIGDHEFEPGTAQGVEKLRYHDEQQDATAFVRPDRDWWLFVRVSVWNLGGEPVEGPTTDAFTLQVEGQTYEPLSELPVEKDAARPRDDVAAGPPGYLTGDTVPPGDMGILQLVFDAPAADRYQLRISTAAGTRTATFDVLWTPTPS